MNDHYFDASPSGPDQRREVTVRAWGHEAAMLTSAGLFSADGLDHATAVLLETLPPPAAGRILDLGCGWGPIACLLALASPSTEVWAVDVNHRALELTRANAERMSATVRTALPDDVPPGLTFDAIWSNPPIRIGKQALHDLLLRWLPRLDETGAAHLVVGRNLGADSLQRWLTGQGWPTERIASSKGFRVLTATRS
ncbi:class I SAM-dependent methyltransferase [Aeromicrobium sp. CTD01-1L150]|uniref:class I SAM-dependent methyltransferase n=1 Tax=Aeromicrobium sp. CTD01-1L150 TaxID=3341830 RepID=UPI0035C1CABD